MGPEGARARALLGVLFFLSGLAALGVETTWLRWFRTLFGATAPAASATLVAFFTGHALGALLAARFAPRLRHPLRTYGMLEIAAAVLALTVPGILAAAPGAIDAFLPTPDASPALLTLLRFGVAIAATLPAAICFGATLPVLGAAVVPGVAALGRAGAGWYAINTAGAAVGTALASFVLPAWLGVTGGYVAAVSLSAGVGAVALGLATRSPSQPVVPGDARPAPSAKAADSDRRNVARSGGGRALPLTLAAISGFAAFGAQVLLIQSFAQVLNGSVYAFGAVLVVVLLFLAVGALCIAALERRPVVAPRSLLAFAFGAAGLALAAFPWLLFQTTHGLRYVGSEGAFPGYLGAALFTVLRSAGPALLPLALLYPLTFALAARVAAQDGARETPFSVTRTLGRLSTANTVGAIAGALAAPWLLLPLLGLWPSFAALGGLLAVASLTVRPAKREVALARDLVLGLGWVAVMTAASPLAVPPVRLEIGERLIASEAGPAGVVAVIERAGERLIRTDNHSVLGGTSERVHQRRQGHLPLLLHPGGKRVAYVGSATGISAGAALSHPIESLRLVEIVPGVADAARHFFREANAGVYEDPRTRLALDDARNFLRGTPERYDVIVADLFVPWRAGTGALYTLEHFGAIRAHLEPDGLFCQWLPLYQLTEAEFRVIVASFLDVFPRSALFRGDFYGGYPIVALVGWNGAVAAPDAVVAATARLAASGETDRWVTDPDGVFSLYVAPLAPFATALADVPRNDDDRPAIEFLAARNHAGGTRGKRDALVGLDFVRLSTLLAETAAKGGDDVYPALSDSQRRAVAGGAALQAAGALYVERKADRAAQAFEAAAGLLPTRLVRDAAADPTAAEVWGDPP